MTNRTKIETESRTDGSVETGRVYEWKYVALAVLLWAGLLVQTLAYEWSSDFRFHTAAIAEFAVNTFNPRHIFLPFELPHHSLSFYHQVLGVFSRATGLSAIDVTQIAAMLNATVLLFVFPKFVRVFIDRRNAPFVALLIVLLAWGPDAWRLSSLLNLNSIGFGLPYPSAFAVWMSMAAIVWLNHIMVRGWKPLSAVPGLLVVGFLISNAHLIAFGILMVPAAALVLWRRSKEGFLGLAVIGVGAVAGAFAWPYFPLFGVADESAVIDWQNYTVYESTLIRLAPSLVGVIPLVQRFRRDRLDPLVTSFAFLLVIFGLGLVVERYVLGRTILGIALTLQLALAGGILELWSGLSESIRRIGGALAVACVAVLSYLAAPGLVRLIPAPLLPASVAADERLVSPVEWIVESDPLLDHDDVVLAQPEISQYFPSTGAKVVYLSPAPFVSDQAEREEFTVEFFESPDASLLDEYDVTWIAYQKSETDDPIGSRLDDMGVEHDLGNVVIVDVGIDG